MRNLSARAVKNRVLAVILIMTVGAGVIWGFVRPRASGAGEKRESTVSSEPARKLSRKAIKARQKVFGIEYVDPETGWVDPNHVILSWVGVTIYAASFGGRVVLLDAWAPTGWVMGSGRYPISLDDMIAIRPEAMFIGHGHFDHLGHAPYIATKVPGIAFYGTLEQCAEVAALAEQMEPGTKLNCQSLLSAERNEPGDRKDHRYLKPVRDGDRLVARGLAITSVLHLHSGPPQNPSVPPDRVPCRRITPDDGEQLAKYPATPAEAQEYLATNRNTQLNGNVIWQFRLDNTFTLTYHDTTAAARDDAPAVLKTLRRLPETDLHLGAVPSFGGYTCMRDIVDYIRAIRPKIFSPTHHAFDEPVLTDSSEAQKADFDPEFARIPPKIRPVVRWTWDPTSERLGDFGRPEAMTYDLNLPFWDDGKAEHEGRPG